MRKRLFVLLFLLVIVLVGCSSNIQETGDIIFWGESESWDVKYLKTSQNEGTLLIASKLPFLQIEDAENIVVEYSLGGISGKSSLERGKNDPPFKETQMRSIFRIPVYLTQERIQTPEIIIIVDDREERIELSS